MGFLCGSCWRASKSKCGPGEASESCACVCASISALWNLLFLGCGRRACPRIIRPCCIVVATSGSIRQGVVCVIDLLEAFCAGGAFGGVGWDAVGVVFESGLFVGVTDLLRGGFGVDFKDFVVVCACCCGKLGWSLAWWGRGRTHGCRCVW